MFEVFVNYLYLFLFVFCLLQNSFKRGYKKLKRNFDNSDSDDSDDERVVRKKKEVIKNIDEIERVEFLLVVKVKKEYDVEERLSSKFF